MQGARPAHIAFEGNVWLYSSKKASWYFITLPLEAATCIRFYVGKKKRGWGSVPVEVTIGNTHWRTSVFPDSVSNSFLLPIKSAVRKAEQIKDQAHIRVQLQIREI